jgi:predicted NBD/HSP70 family sugar kinase
VPAVLWNRAFRERCQKASGARPVALALVQPGGGISRFDTAVLPEGDPAAALNFRYIERLVKTLLWSRGGCRVIFGGAPEVAAALARSYGAGGARAFDAKFLGDQVCGAPFVVESRPLAEVPEAKESERRVGRHLEGCRIGFDLGGSDRKCAAVVDGQCIYSEEIRWDPYFQSDPQYHYDGIQDSLSRAAARLPRVDAIGGSAAGVYVNNEIRGGSLFRGVSAAEFERRVRRMFFDLQRAWGGVPFEVANDGEVTALAGSMCLGENRVLGISMGTSVAAGYVCESGSITGWLNELAFVPVDFREEGPLDEWSGDRGCAVQYFCQQGVARLAPHAGLHFPPEMKAAERLVEVQRLVDAGDPRAGTIFASIGICFGYALAQFAELYDARHVLLLGRVLSGEGGSLLLREARHVLDSEFPELSSRIHLHTPGEKEKRHGQAVAAASLPSLAL